VSWGEGFLLISPSCLTSDLFRLAGFPPSCFPSLSLYWAVLFPCLLLCFFASLLLCFFASLLLLGFPLVSPYAFPSILPSLENTRFFPWFLPRVSLLFPSSMILFPTRRLLLFSSNTAARSAPIRSSAPHRCHPHNAACCCKRQLCCNHQPAGHSSHPAATNPHPAGPSH
jgi:hypothetical protein